MTNCLSTLWMLISQYTGNPLCLNKILKNLQGNPSISVHEIVWWWEDCDTSKALTDSQCDEDNKGEKGSLSCAEQLTSF